MNEYKITDKMHSWQKTYPVWVSALSVIVLLIIWELICRAGIVSPLFLPSPTGILSALADMVAGGEIAVSLAASMYRIILGFVLGSVIGLAVGLFTGTSALIDRIGSPIVNALYPIPKIALAAVYFMARHRRTQQSNYYRPGRVLSGSHEYIFRRKKCRPAFN